MWNVFDPYHPNFRIERWFGHAPQIVAGAESVTTAHAAFEAECLAHPKRKITLRHGLCVLREAGEDPLDRGTPDAHDL